LFIGSYIFCPILVAVPLPSNPLIDEACKAELTINSFLFCLVVSVANLPACSISGSTPILSPVVLPRILTDPSSFGTNLYVSNIGGSIISPSTISS